VGNGGVRAGDGRGKGVRWGERVAGVGGEGGGGEQVEVRGRGEEGEQWWVEFWRGRKWGSLEEGYAHLEARGSASFLGG